MAISDLFISDLRNLFTRVAHVALPVKILFYLNSSFSIISSSRWTQTNQSILACNNEN